MRWDALRAGAPGDGSPPAQPAPMLFEQRAVTRTFDTPAFRGMTFFEVQARSIINRVPDASRVPFRWTINPYRGCSHACVYCFARNTHTYLDLDAGHDFDSKIVVKVNAPDLVRKELASPRLARRAHRHGHQRGLLPAGRGRYQLMPGIIGALRDARNPFSILTKGTLILRDLDLLLRGRRGDRRRAERVGGLRGHRAVAGTGAGHAQPATAAGGVRRVHRSGAAVRRADGTGRAVPVRLPGAARGHRAADRTGGRHLGHADRAAPAARGAGVVPALAGRGAPGPGAPLPRLLRPRCLCSGGLPAAGDRAGPRRWPGGTASGAAHPARRGAAGPGALPRPPRERRRPSPSSSPCSS